MKKNYLMTVLTVLLMTLSSFGFVSCGGDDDDANSDGPSTAGVLDKDSNIRVKSIGNYTFYYNDKGQVDYITEGNSRYDFTYNPNKIVMSYRGTVEDEFTVSYNGLGYITRLEVNETFQEEGTVEINGSASLNYDSSGHLTSVNGSSTEKYKGVTTKSTGTATLKWQNNRLISATWETTEQDEDGTSIYTEQYDYDYANNINDYHNKHHQYAPSLEGAYGDDPDEALALVGLLGSGPLYLPSSCTQTWNEKTRASDSGSKTTKFGYAFNDDGSIKYCDVNSSRYNYSYEYLPDTRSAEKESSDQGRKMFRLLFPNHRR